MRGVVDGSRADSPIFDDARRLNERSRCDDSFDRDDADRTVSGSATRPEPIFKIPASR